ncbi:hypothetical protein [Methanoregula sp.]|uniref:hypothetical protein n=1 Tax=Methanoregula sp. TaxID=2052170 RepID=UPI003BAF2040
MPETEMDYLGTGFKIINFPTWAIRNSDGVEEPQITEEASAYVQERMNFLRFERGKFISGCTEIDNVLGEAISAFFFREHRDEYKRGQFHDFIIDTTIFSFSQRKNVIQQIMKKYPREFPLLDSHIRQIMFEQIDYVIKMRNAFAHGKIIINYRERTNTLSYFNSSKNRIEELPLNSELFSTLSTITDDLSSQIIENCIFGEVV